MHDPKTNANTWQGVKNCLLTSDLYKSSKEVFVLNNPLRLELAHNSSIDYTDHCLPDTKVVIRKDIEKFNFYPIKEHEMLGWLNGEGIADLKVIKEDKVRDANEFFALKEGKFYPCREMQVFMATTQRSIAMPDCLFYFIC